MVNANDHLSGVLIYAVEPGFLAVAKLDVLPGYQGLGAGKMLIDAVKAKAADGGDTAVLAYASNDDLPAIYFYQRNGFQIYEVKPNLVAERLGTLKVGFAGIPYRDEIRLRWEPGKP